MMKSCTAGVLALLLAAPAWVQPLTFFTWEDYVAESVVADWERDTGIEIKQVYFDSDSMRDVVLGSGRAQGFDLVVIDKVAGSVLKDNQLIAPMTEVLVPNLRHVEARWADSCGDFGMPYAWGTVGIVYRRDRVAQAPTSWRDLLDPVPEQRGHIVMHEDSMDTLIPPLLALGYDINSEDRDALRASFEWLQRQLSHVLSYDYVLTYAKDPERRAQVNMALAYSGDQDTLNDLDGEDTWGYVVPREGTGVWMDCVSVLAGSTRKEAAYRLVNYLAEPLSAARFVEEVAVATPNASGRAMLDGRLRDDPAIFPAGDILAASSTYRMPSEHAMILRNRIVKSLVRAHEAQ